MDPGGDRANQSRRRGQAPGFPPSMASDPFAGLMGHMGMGMGNGMGMGMGMGGSLFDDFFSRSPFDDPFFNRPFGSMFGSTGGLFGPGGLMGSMSMGMGMGGFFENGSLPNRPFPPTMGFLEQQQQQQQQQQHHYQRGFDHVARNLPQTEGRRGPVIEELPDDHEEAPEAKSQDNQQPIIEHPDDDVGPRAEVRGQPRLSQNRSVQASPANSGYQSSSQFQSFSFQSSSVSYGSGSGGTYYSSSSSRRVGPDGVMEEEHVEKDSSGKESRSIARGYRDKVHAITKKKVATGPENTLETLHNLTPEEAPDFDTQWEARAQRSLPGWRRSHSQMLEGNSFRQNRQARPALQYDNEGSCEGNQPPKKQIKI